ncbi:hypothetical protein TU58_25395 [Bacillus cereus]|nr:hypothetical protein TU58_25395 [Bacillus cereus]
MFYLLGLLNSKLFAIYNYGTSPKAKKGLFPKILVTDVRKLPIRLGEQSQQMIIENLVKKMIELLDENLGNTSEIENIQAEIDKLVFEIYDINEEDQKLLLSIIQ